LIDRKPATTSLTAYAHANPALTEAEKALSWFAAAGVT
jgi:hypothetical protein